MNGLSVYNDFCTQVTKVKGEGALLSNSIVNFSGLKPKAAFFISAIYVFLF